MSPRIVPLLHLRLQLEVVFFEENLRVVQGLVYLLNFLLNNLEGSSFFKEINLFYVTFWQLSCDLDCI